MGIIVMAAYTIPKGSNFKTYTVSGSYTANGFGTKDVIKVANGSGNERFYVMALSNVDSSTHCWYYDAYGNMDDYASTTSGDFGAGEKNTQTMISKWNSSAYGSQNAGSIYRYVGIKCSTKWNMEWIKRLVCTIKRRMGSIWSSIWNNKLKLYKLWPF